jgi:peptide-methionine (S)-S-oxide reductase
LKGAYDKKDIPVSISIAQVGMRPSTKGKNSFQKSKMIQEKEKWMPMLRKGIRLAFVTALLILCVCSSANPGSTDGNTRYEIKVMEHAGDKAAPGISIPPLDKIVPTKTETATFSLGWFWGPDSRFGIVKGVVRTRVGYAGGTKRNPAYHDLGDHTETIQIDFDPTQVSYRELLDIFWDSHSPTTRVFSKQYQSIIFYHNAEQRRLAIETKDREAAKIHASIYTEIVPFSGFYMAENYHQKYLLQREQYLIKEFELMYPLLSDLINSTAAARVNGYLGGHGTYRDLQVEIHDFGLSQSAMTRLLNRVRAHGNWILCLSLENNKLLFL